jgi:NAD(P)-dependent dehydrogenase (short-subunit alcohol dehydrogenase family)
MNLSAALRLCRAFVPFMREQRWGHRQCFVARRALADLHFRCELHGGKSRPFALSARSQGIGRTELPRIVSRPVASTRPASCTAGENAEIAKHILLGRAGTAEEVAATIAFCVGGGRLRHRAVIDVNGGIFMG